MQVGRREAEAAVPSSRRSRNIGRNASANSIGVLKRSSPPRRLISRHVRIATAGTEIVSVVVTKRLARLVPHPGQGTCGAPHDEAQHADQQHRADQLAISEQRLACVGRDDLGDDAHRRQQQDVHLGVREEPEQVLPEDRVAASRAREDGRAVDQVLRDVEAGAGDAIEKLQDRPASSTGNASSRSTAVTSCAQQNTGRRPIVSPSRACSAS